GANVTGLHGTQADLVGTTFDGNHDGIPDAGQDDVADIRAINGQTVVLEARGHELTNIQALAAPAGQNTALPLGMFGFRVHDVTPGGAATVRVFLPGGFAPNGWLKQDPATGALQDFSFDGTTGAEIDGNVATLHLVDGGRGDADGIVNGH